ncbi:hypothetical protein V491_01634, partial [Pseudogymnoascus sp. VKM F-3775]
MDEVVSLPQLDLWSGIVTMNSNLQFEDERYREERLVTEEEEEEELETTTVISSDASDKATRVMKVNYATDLPEYPETSENGVAYIINTSSMSEEAVEVMCNNHSTPANYHFFRPIPATLYSELAFIQERLNGTITASNELCAVIEQNSTRRQHCGVDHFQGCGKLIHQNCNVQFRLFRPYDLIDCPYIIWTSHGVHCHPPPPPSRTPQQLVNSLLTVIKKINDPSLTTRTLLKNPALQSFYEQWNGKSLSDVHKSLINLDKISFILRKQQLLNYPFGQHLIGVQHEWDVSHKNKPNSYIKELILNEENFMAVCFYTEAAKVLLKRDSFELDMTFKRIKASDINEVVFAAFLPELNKVMTFVRVFVNQESTEMYTSLFHTVFNAIAKETGQRIQWKHLHQSGFGSVVMDMDSKQMS